MPETLNPFLAFSSEDLEGIDKVSWTIICSFLIDPIDGLNFFTLNVKF
jgi:hypothetical protein